MISATDMRKRQGLTIEDCAKANGVCVGTWSRWENGKVKKMLPPEQKLKPLIEKSARHFYDGMVQTDIEDFTGESQAQA